MMQRILRQSKTAERLAKSIEQHLPKNYDLGPLYLRAERPNIRGQERVPWHREEMYGAPKGTLNFWMPIQGVTQQNTLQYIPGSDLIPDSAIVTEQKSDPEIIKGSEANEIGLLYAPKHIISGVDLDAAVPLMVPKNHAALFSGSLIHGGKPNTGRQLRYSIDFRILPEAKDWSNVYSQQDPQEIQWLQNRIRGAKSMLEIGSCHGNSLRLFAQVLSPGAVIRSIDLGDGTDWREGVNTMAELQQTMRDLREQGFDAKVHFVDSHWRQSIEWARQWAPYDFLFIDAEHSYEGVKADWENYGPMANIIAFHDIAYEPREVRHLWAELKSEFITDECIASRMGIGLITQAAVEYRNNAC